MSVRACKDCWRIQRSQAPKRARVGSVHSERRKKGPFQTSREESSKISDSVNGQVTDAKPDCEEDSLGVRAALAMLGFYRNIISPLLPSSCRYLPTCSEYSKEAYREFGVSKGTVLTAWRLLRCNPWGGRGYDPPRWPPPGLEKTFAK